MKKFKPCPGNPTNLCIFARRCPHHGDAAACAEKVERKRKR